MTVSEARAIVFARDQYRCVAPRLDPDAGPCYDKDGKPFSGYDPTGEILEMDRVRDFAGSKAPDHADPTREYLACPGHHRGEGPTHGRVWATANRNLLRAYLAGVNDRAVA